MDQTITIVIKHSTLPSLHLDVEGSWSIRDVKLRLRERFPGQPPIGEQRLLIGSEELVDDTTIAQVLLQVSFCFCVRL